MKTMLLKVPEEKIVYAQKNLYRKGVRATLTQWRGKLLVLI